MTKKRLAEHWTAYDIGREQGMIAAWEHTILCLRSCIRAHKKALKGMMIDAKPNAPRDLRGDSRVTVHADVGSLDSGKE